MVTAEEPAHHRRIVVCHLGPEPRLEPLVERHVEHDVERANVAFTSQVEDASIHELGVRRGLGDAKALPVHEISGPSRQLRPCDVPPRRIAVRRGRSSAVVPMRRENEGNVLKTKGSAIVTWKTMGRHETWGRMSMPSA